MQDLNKPSFMTVEEAKEGRKIILKIIKRLVDSSFEFLNVGRYSTSIPLSILALEELAKADLLRRAIKDDRDITVNEWSRLTSWGGKSHVHKLIWMLEKKEEGLQRWTENDVQIMNQINRNFGITLSYPDKKSMQEDVVMFKNLVPKLKDLKEDCLYSNWDPRERRWNYFDRRFTEDVKSLLASYLYLEARKEFFLQKMWSDISDKKFKDYTNEDWKKLEGSTNRKEAYKIMEDTMKKIGTNMDLIVSALKQYERPVFKKK